MENIIELICCKENGLSKSEITKVLLDLGFYQEKINRFFNRIHYARKRSGSFSVILLNENNKWRTFDNFEHSRNVLNFLKANPSRSFEKPTEIPYWLYEDYTLIRGVLYTHNLL